MSKWSSGIICAGAALYCAVTVMAATDLPKTGEAHATYLTKGIWTWFGDPKAVYYKGTYEKTYVSFFDITTNPGNILISSYNHATKKIESFIVDSGFGYDDHNHPSILLRNTDHRILIFWCGHSGGKMYMRVSKNPEDVTSWDSTRVILPGGTNKSYTYPNPYQLSAENNRIYIFYRGIDWQQTLAYSDDGGKTWSDELKYFSGGDRPYHKYHSNNIDHIVTVMDYDNRALPEYFLCIKNNGFYGVDGNLVKTFADVKANGPILSTDLPQIFIKGTTGNASVWDVAEDSKGRPVFVSDSIQNGHHYWWTRWTGSKWEKHYLINSGKEMGGEFGFACGITLDHANPDIVYLSHWVKKSAAADSMVELERWVTKDSGTTWQKTALTANSAAMNTRPCVPRGYTGGAVGVIWLYVREYGNWYGPFDADVKMYAFPDNPTATLPEAGTRKVAATSALLFVKDRIGFRVVDPKTTSLALYDLAGRLVKDFTPLARAMDKGDHAVKLDAGLLPYSTYLARYTSGNVSAAVTVIFIK
jgi:hypothetical protein